jgi:hypothetical protein
MPANDERREFAQRHRCRGERTHRFDRLRAERLFDEQRLGAAVRQNVADLPRL